MSNGYETASLGGPPPTRRIPEGYETTDRFADRDDVRRRGAKVLAKAGHLGVAARLILRNKIGRPGVRPSDVETRLFMHELRELEFLAADGEAERRRSQNR